MMMELRRSLDAWRVLAVVTILAGMGVKPAWGQVPGLPVAPAKAQGSSTAKGASAEAKPAVATPAGPITVHRQVSDSEIARFLSRFLPKYPGVRILKIAVDDGVVTLEGRVDDDDTQDEITDVVKRVEGVRLVLNQTNTDEEVMTGMEFAQQELGNFVGYFERKWILLLIALAIVAVSWFLAQMSRAHAETLLAPLVHNVLLRSVVGSVISGLLVIGGLVLALAALRLTQMVMSILGVSGLIVIAVGFAFRDITENFIASVLLGLRRPFQIGDYVTIAGQSGVVKSLNTRATVLVTLEGKHVRIPNSTIFKEIMVNATASPSFRTTFDVVIPNEASTAAAIEAINRALRATKGILNDPPPRTLVEALESGGVRLRADFWTPTHNIDWFQLLSDAKLQTKVVAPAGRHHRHARRPAGRCRGQARRPGAGNSNGAPAPSPAAATAAEQQAAANLARDVRAARNAPTAVVANGETPVARALQEPETRVSNEGENLLKGKREE